MSKSILKSQIHRKALRAAAGVALFGGSFACGGEMPSGPLPEARRSDLGNARVDAGQDRATVDSGETVNPPPIDAGVHVETDSGFALDAGMMADASTSTVGDAGTEQCDQSVLSWEDYVKCCDMYNWDWSRGCQAWGPPAPPSMAIDLEEVV